MRPEFGKILLVDISSLFSFCDDNGATASLWLVAAMGIGILTALWPLLFKLLQKLASDSEIRKIWKMSSTWLLIFSGLFVAAFFLFLAYYLAQDFHDCVSGQGFFFGLFAAWLSYLIVVVMCHLLTPWRRELIRIRR